MALLKAVILLGVLTAALGCNEFMYNSSTGAMSARALDQGYSWDLTFQYVPQGARLEGVPTNSSNILVPYTAKYGFALVASEQQGFAQRLGLNFTTPPLGGSTDGLNSEGLSAAVLYDPEGNETFAATVNASETVISMLDWVAYALASYATVEEARTAISSGAVSISAPYTPVSADVSFFATPYHSVLRDASRDQMVVEFNSDGRLMVYNERSFVLTNGPSFPVHLEQLSSWLATNTNGQRPTYLQAPQASSFYQNLTFSANNQTATTTAPSQWWPFPGDYSSSSRFIRLSMLNQMAQTSIQYPNNATWSPAAYPGPYPYKPLFDATEGFLQTVLLPLGVDDKGGINPPDIQVSDFWQFAAIRDHDSKLFFYRTPSSPGWKLMDVAALAAKPQPNFLGYSLPANFAANRTWFEDVSAVACASPDAQEEAETFQQEVNEMRASFLAGSP